MYRGLRADQRTINNAQSMGYYSALLQLATGPEGLWVGLSDIDDFFQSLNQESCITTGRYCWYQIHCMKCSALSAVC